MVTALALPKHVYAQTVKGRTYYRYRPPNGGPQVRLLGNPGEAVFDACYQQAINAPQPPKLSEATRESIARYVIRESLARAGNRARACNLPFDLTKGYVAQMVEDQGYKCAVSGIPFDLSRTGQRRVTSRLPFRPSIDRIEPALGYVQGNVRILCFAVNMAIADWGDDVFREICRAVGRK